MARCDMSGTGCYHFLALDDELLGRHMLAICKGATTSLCLNDAPEEGCVNGGQPRQRQETDGPEPSGKRNDPRSTGLVWIMSF